jgi:hypothetical protein
VATGAGGGNGVQPASIMTAAAATRRQRCGEIKNIVIFYLSLWVMWPSYCPIMIRCADTSMFQLVTASRQARDFTEHDSAGWPVA